MSSVVKRATRRTFAQRRPGDSQAASFTLPMLCAALGFWCSTTADAGERPNVIVVLTDDQGYGDLGCFGAQDVRTPRIDRMAAEGVRLTSYYAGAQVCTPSRAALLTGCYPERVGNLPVLFPHSDEGLHPDEITIAEMLRAAGYATACIGKWHLGHHPEFLPTSQGFDEYFGVPYSNDMGVDPQMPLAADACFREGRTVDDFRRGRGPGPPLMRGAQVVEWPIDQALLTRRYTEETQRFVRDHAHEPFFIYLAHSMPHVPLYASDELSGKSASGLYGDAIEELDWSMGRILETLAECGVAERTLVIYTSDNGPWNFPSNATDKVQGNRNRRVGGSAGPLRGSKFSTWEGGMRVPCVVRWPQRIPAGGSCDRPVSAIDILPTLAAACGAAPPTGRRIDGRDLLPLLTSAAAVKYADPAYFYRTAGVRVGSWKWHKGQLFNLASDPGETTDCRAARPEVATKLEKLLEEHRQTLQAEQRPPGSVVRPAHPLIGLEGWTVQSGRWNVRPDGSLRQGAARRPAVAESPAWNEAVAEVALEVQCGAAAGRGWSVRVAEADDNRAIALAYVGGPVGELTITLPVGPAQQVAAPAANEPTTPWQRVRLVVNAGQGIVHWNECEVHCGVLPAEFRPTKVVLATDRTQADFRRLDIIDAAGGILTRLSDPASVTP